MDSMLELLRAIAPLRMAPVSPDTDRCVEILKGELPFQVHEFESLREHNGWVAPQSWFVRKAEIRKDGRLVYDGLAQRPRKYSYRLIVAPEHFGTVFYVASLAKERLAELRHGIFLEAVGNNARFALQHSFTGSADIDQAAVHYLSQRHPDATYGEFRTIIGNDETVWEAPGVEVPTVSLSRFPFPEYHTSMDTEDIILEERLEEAVEAVLGITEILETNCAMRRTFDGLV